MRAVVRVVLLALCALALTGTRAAEAQLWKPAKKTATTAPAKPARAKPTKPKRRAPRASRPAARPAVVRDDPPRRDRARPTRGDDLPEYDDAPVIVVELPARGER